MTRTTGRASTGSALRPYAIVFVACISSAACALVSILSPLAAAAAVGVFLFVVALALVRIETLAIGLLCGLPWLLVFSDFFPPLLRTILAAAAVGLMLLVVSPLPSQSELVTVGGALLAVALLVGLVQATNTSQLIQVAKYLMFAGTALVVASKRGRDLVVQSGPVVFKSCVAALVVHAFVIFSGLGSAEPSKYEVGDTHGYAVGAHELALLSLVVCGASFVFVKSAAHRAALISLGSIIILETGVRSALIPLGLIVLYMILRTRLSGRYVAVAAVSVAVVVASGAASVVTARYNQSVNRGELTDSAKAGSGRGALWQTDLGAYASGGPSVWVFGFGLRYLAELNSRLLAAPVFGQSDVVDLLTQVGAVALVGWLLIWLGLIRLRCNPLIVQSLLIFGIVNGALEYVTPMLLGVFLGRLPIGSLGSQVGLRKLARDIKW